MEPGIKVLGYDTTSHRQELTEGFIQSALRAATNSQLLGHVPLAATPASGSAVAPRGENHAKNQHKLKLKKAKKDVCSPWYLSRTTILTGECGQQAAAAQQETSFQAAAQQETDAEQVFNP